MSQVRLDLDEQRGAPGFKSGGGILLFKSTAGRFWEQCNGSSGGGFSFSMDGGKVRTKLVALQTPKGGAAGSIQGYCAIPKKFFFSVMEDRLHYAELISEPQALHIFWRPRDV